MGEIFRVYQVNFVPQNVQKKQLVNKTGIFYFWNNSSIIYLDIKVTMSINCQDLKNQKLREILGWPKWSSLA